MTISPSPENAAEIAEMVVPFALTNYGVTLDYEVSSLGQVDGIVDDLRRDQEFEPLQPLLFAFGCYVGEVFVRNAQGTWRTTDGMGMSDVASTPIVIAMPDGRGCNPVGKVYKRFRNGPDDNLAWFYHVMVEAPPRKPSDESR